MLAQFSDEESKRQKVSGTCAPPRNAQAHLHTRAGRATGSFNDAKHNGESEMDGEEEEENEGRPRRGGNAPAENVSLTQIRAIARKLDEQNKLAPLLNMLRDVLKLQVEAAGSAASRHSRRG